MTLGMLTLAAAMGFAWLAPNASADLAAPPCLLPDAVAQTEQPSATIALDGSGQTVFPSSEVLRPYVATRIAATGCAWPNDVRAIVVDRDEVRLQVGGRVVRRLPVVGVGDSTAVALGSVAELIGDPTWMRLRNGIVTVAAAIVQAPGTELTIGDEVVREVRLLDLPYVGIIGSSARASFRDVTVVSWSASADKPVPSDGQPRPFVHYSGGSRVDVSDSVFAWLGSAATGATGVTWSDRSGGTVVSTVFSDNFVGITASESDQLVLMFNAVRRNVTDGVLVLDDDGGATIDTNTVQGNGADGIVIQGSSNSMIRNNHVWRNGRYGIVLEGGTTDASVIDNVVETNGVAGLVRDDVEASRVVGNVLGGTSLEVASAQRAAEGAAALMDSATDAEHQQLLDVGLVGALLAAAGLSLELSRRIVSRLRNQELIDLTAQARSVGKADSVPTSAH